MGFIINGIANIFFEAVGAAISLMLSLVSNLSMDLGEEHVHNKRLARGMFDNVFQNASNFKNAFLITAFVLLIILFMLKLLTSLFGPITGSSEEPIALTVSTFISAFLIWFSYDIFRIFQKIADSLLDVFKESSPDSNLFKGKEFFNFFGKDENKLVRNQDYEKELKQANENRGDRDIYYSGKEEDTELSTLIISFVVFFVIMVNLLKLFLEMYERYVVLGVLFYTAPLAFVAISSKSTMDIFRSWVRMVVSQFLLMMMNVFFLSVFTYSFKHQIDLASTHNGYIFNSWTTFITTSLLWVGWLMVGQKVDQHLQSVGLSTAQSGGGMAGALIAGAGTFMAGARTAYNMVKSGVNHSVDTASRLKNGMHEKNAGGRFSEGFTRKPSESRKQRYSDQKQEKQNAAKARENVNTAKANFHTFDKDGRPTYDLNAAQTMADSADGITGTEARELASLYNAGAAFENQSIKKKDLENKDTKFEAKNGVITATTKDGRTAQAFVTPKGRAQASGPMKTVAASSKMQQIADSKNIPAQNASYIASSQVVNKDTNALKEQLIKNGTISAKDIDSVTVNKGVVSWGDGYHAMCDYVAEMPSVNAKEHLKVQDVNCSVYRTHGQNTDINFH